MYLHFDFHEATLREYFPSELGEIEVKFQSESKIAKNFYFIDENPLIDTNTNKGLLNNVKNINLFVGTNNSGKSRLLRCLFKMQYFISDTDLSPLDIYFRLQCNDLINNNKSSFDVEIEDELKKYWRTLDGIMINPHLIDERERELIDVKKAYELKYLVHNLTSSKKKEILQECINIIEDIFLLFEKLKFHYLNKLESCIYVPILRSLITHQGFGADTFDKIVKDKFKLNGAIFTGLNLYHDLDELHTSADIVVLDKFCEWIRDNFYRDKKVRILPDKKSQNVLFQIDTKLTPMHDLGDGVQQLILLMFPIFRAANNTWFFIEEPETHLHPGLQRIFIETLLNDEYLKGKNLKFFFTTHSNHFLDISINHDEISIFQFEKVSDEKFNIKSNVKPNKNVLDLLGVNSSSVFLANASIWVEGPTDRRYISKWLKLYCEHYEVNYLREDIDFAFFEYGGNLIKHYLFDGKEFEEEFDGNQIREKINSFALSNKIYLLADNDNVNQGSAKQKRRESLEALSGKNFYYQNTQYREIENLLPVKILNDFLLQLVNNPDASKLDEINFSREDYYQIGLGEFITDLFSKSKIKGKSFKSKTGDTLSSPYKTKLCDFVVNSDYKYSDLIQDNDYLDKIITDLYNFIKAK